MWHGTCISQTDERWEVQTIYRSFAVSGTRFFFWFGFVEWIRGASLSTISTVNCSQSLWWRVKPPFADSLGYRLSICCIYYPLIVKFFGYFTVFSKLPCTEMVSLYLLSISHPGKHKQNILDFCYFCKIHAWLLSKGILLPSTLVFVCIENT